MHSPRLSVFLSFYLPPLILFCPFLSFFSPTYALSPSTLPLSLHKKNLDDNNLDADRIEPMLQLLVNSKYQFFQVPTTWCPETDFLLIAKHCLY